MKFYQSVTRKQQQTESLLPRESQMSCLKSRGLEEKPLELLCPWYNLPLQQKNVVVQ